ncbi:MAG: hypothetical protein ACI4NE_00065 [Succinivibrio sp.]
MSGMNDESWFAAAYHEKDVTFRKFDERSEERKSLNNSSFSLIRQIAEVSEKNDDSNELSATGEGLKDHDSVMSLIKGEKSKPTSFNAASVSISQAAKPLTHRSSLISFLREDNDEAGIAARTPLENYYNPSERSGRYAASQDGTVSLREYSSAQSSNGSGRYSSLFKSKNQQDQSSGADDSLQSIYKRLLKCQ